MRQPSLMSPQQRFSEVPVGQIQRSVFDRSHGVKTTWDAGLIYPFMWDFLLPGDHVKLDTKIVGRLMTMWRPILDNLHVDLFAHVVPFRLVWDNWQKFQGERLNPEDSIDFILPHFAIAPEFEVETGSLADYLGFALGHYTASYVSAGGLTPTSVIHRAYNLIWNEWFRDENLQDRIPVPTGDGPDNYYQFRLMPRGKRPDYFTSCLPWPQKGEAVMLPLGSTAPVVGNGLALGLQGPTASPEDLYLGFSPVTSNTGGNAQYGRRSGDPDTIVPGLAFNENFSITGYRTIGVNEDPDRSGLVALLNEATAATINQIREGFVAQQILEGDARWGTRYIEQLIGRWSVDPGDSRLQRPEFIGGSSTYVRYNSIDVTAPVDGAEPGDLGGRGTIDANLRIRYSATEHMILIVSASIRADLTYQQGNRAQLYYRTRYDFPMPETMHLGEAPVFNREIYFSENASADNSVFGYQERFAAERYFPSQITGLMRSTAPGTLDVWHLSQKFTELPTLGEAFIEENPPIDRVITVPSEPAFVIDIFNRYTPSRPMPVRSIPGLQRL